MIAGNPVVMLTPPSSVAGVAVMEVRPSEAPSLAAVRNWLRQQLGAPHPEAELVLTELVTNAIDHGSDGVISVELAQRDAQIQLMVSNAVAGPGAGRVARDHDRSMADPLSIRGRGLAIVDRLVKVLRIDHDPSTSRLTVTATLA